MEVIIDMQGFRTDSEKFIVKEIAGVSIGSGWIRGVRMSKPVQLHSLFKPPCNFTELSKSYRKMNSWLTNNHHGLSWESGCLDYPAVKDFLHAVMKDVKVIYVKGLDKKEWLNSMLDGKKVIVEMDEHMKCPSLGSLKLLYLEHTVKCTHHEKYDVNRGNDYCALDNAFRLKKWYMDPTPYFMDTIGLFLREARWSVVVEEDDQQERTPDEVDSNNTA